VIRSTAGSLILLVAAVLLFIAAALVALGPLSGDFDALVAIGLACFAAAQVVLPPVIRP
jgi:hypothetical protein